MAEVEMQVELVQTGGITYFSFHQKPRPNPTLPGRLRFCPVAAKVLGAQCPDTTPWIGGLCQLWCPKNLNLDCFSAGEMRVSAVVLKD